MPTNTELRDVVGSRGEKIVEICLTDYQAFPRPLFRPGFLGDEWPAIDFYVELTSVRGKSLTVLRVKPTPSTGGIQDTVYGWECQLFAEIKTAGSAITPASTYLDTLTKKRAIERLL